MDTNKNYDLTLWTHDFTIITLGSVISMLGNGIAGFAIGLMVLDYTHSTFMYTLFIVLYNLPKLIMPLLIGPYLDAYSRKKVIYSLDFFSSGLYLVTGLLLMAGYFNFFAFSLLALLIGAIDSTYQVAYDSLYPTLVVKENYRKAYSISSMLNIFSVAVVPVAAYVYDLVGIGPLFLFNAATFFVAAVMETRIQAKEEHIGKGQVAKFNLADYKKDFIDGLGYIKREKGLMIITAYFFFTFIAMGADALVMPYFRTHETYTVQMYTYIMIFAMAGRFVGGNLHYRFKFPAEKKYMIAVSAYLGVAVLGGTYLFYPYPMMQAVNFIIGLCGVTSFNIRTSATQSYVPNEMRGRFNGTFQMITTLGGILSQLTAGALAEILPIRSVVMGLYAVNFVAIFAVMIAGRKHVKPIYNMDV